MFSDCHVFFLSRNELPGNVDIKRIWTRFPTLWEFIKLFLDNNCVWWWSLYLRHFLLCKISGSRRVLWINGCRLWMDQAEKRTKSFAANKALVLALMALSQALVLRQKEKFIGSWRGRLAKKKQAMALARGSAFDSETENRPVPKLCLQIFIGKI